MTTTLVAAAWGFVAGVSFVYHDPPMVWIAVLIIALQVVCAYGAGRTRHW